MAQPYSTGAAGVYLKFSTGEVDFLGHGEQAVEIEERPDYEPVMNDLAGPRKPFDLMMCGNDGMVSFTLTRWNEAVHAKAAAFGDPGVGARGTEGVLDRGTLMLLEGKAMELYITYPRSILAAYTTLPAGYHFFATVLQAPLHMSPGVRPYKVRMVFWAIASYNVSAGGGFSLYDHVMGALPEID